VPAPRVLLPGPAQPGPAVLRAMQGPTIPLFGPAMDALLAGLEQPLRGLFRTSRPVLLASCSSTGLMEAALRGGVRRRVLVVVGGFFGERLAQVAEACGKEVVRLQVHEGRTVEPDQLARLLGGPPVDAVALVHSETSTGALAPLEALAAVVREHERRAGGELLLLVDAVTSIGASPVESERWGLDFVFTGSQKALALPPGLALGVASERFLARARAQPAPGWYFDVPRQEAALVARRPIQTPPLPLLYALAARLAAIDAEGGVEACWTRHAAMRAAVERWAGERGTAAGMTLLPPAGRRSASVSALRVPAGRSARALASTLLERGWLVSAGLGALEDDVLRIGHMGEVAPADVDACLAALDEVLRGRV